MAVRCLVCHVRWAAGLGCVVSCVVCWLRWLQLVYVCSDCTQYAFQFDNTGKLVLFIPVVAYELLAKKKIDTWTVSQSTVYRGDTSPVSYTHLTLPTNREV